MKSMRILILLTFILYDTQCAPGLKTFKRVKSLLLSKLLPSFTKKPTLEAEIYPVYECDHATNEDGESVIEWSPQPYGPHDSPIIIAIDHGESNHGEIPVENHKINDEENCDGIHEVGYHANEKETKNEWLLGKITGDKKPVIIDSDNHGEVVHHGGNSLKDKIKAKIQLIKSKMALKTTPILSVPKIDGQDSAFLFEENIKSTVKSTSLVPSTTVEPIVNIEHFSTVNPITTTAGHITPIIIPHTTTKHLTTTMNPAIIFSEPEAVVNVYGESEVKIPNPLLQTPHKFYISPVSYQVLISNNCPPPLTQEACYQPNLHYVHNPVYPNVMTASVPFDLGTAVGYYGTNIKNPNAYIGVTKVINYNNDGDNNNNHNVGSYDRPEKPIVSLDQDDQWSRYAYGNNLKPVVEYPLPSPSPSPPPSPPSSYIPQTVRPEIPVGNAYQPAVSGIVQYPTSTSQPINVYSTDIDVQQRYMQTKPEVPEEQWDRFLGPAPESIDDSGHPQQNSRGDISFEDKPYEQQQVPATADDYSYQSRGLRRQVGSNDNNEGKPILPQGNIVRMSFPSKISTGNYEITPTNQLQEIPVAEQTENKSITAKTEKSQVEKTARDEVLSIDEKTKDDKSA